MPDQRQPLNPQPNVPPSDPSGSEQRVNLGQFAIPDNRVDSGRPAHSNMVKPEVQDVGI